jgi:hypothetical protein
MAWKGRGLPDLDFSNLISSLNTSGFQKTNNAVYQVIFQLISKIQVQRDQLIIKFKAVADNITEIGDTIVNTVNSLKDATFWTKENETLFLPSSFRVIAGTGVTLTYGTNTVTISADGSGGVIPMINGDEPPQLMSDGAGNLILIPFVLDIEIP